MIRLDSKYLLFVEPQRQASPAPVVDELTRVVAGVLRDHAKRGLAYMGVHACVCGAESAAFDLLVRPDGTSVGELEDHYLDGPLAGLSAQEKAARFLRHRRAPPPPSSMLAKEGGITNTLAVHYLAHHRDEVPESELAKVQAFVAAWKRAYPNLTKTEPTGKELRP